MNASLLRQVQVLFVIVALAGTVRAAEPPSLQAKAYQALDQVREEKRTQLTAYFDRMELLAKEARDDSLINWYFTIEQRYWKLQQESPAPAEAKRTIKALRESERSYYLSHYQPFYNILLVDKSGYVLSSMRTQRDYHQNLLEGDLQHTALSAHLRQKPKEAFVDYQFYWVSDEPSAFFVEPLVVGGQHQGWLVLQCAINKINAIFSRGNVQGNTGETFLVNRQHQMLTESRLYPNDGTPLRGLANENIEAKFAEREGHKRVIDYRGYPVLTSFSVCPVLDSEWLVVAKIDEDEVITRYFQDNLASLEPALIKKLPTLKQMECSAQELPKSPLVVDMDEFRISHQEPLITFGVSTCTAIVITLPGKIAYMGHASVNDRIYGAGELDVLGTMLRSIRQFEILPYQLRGINIFLVAPHQKSFSESLKMLLDAGIFLSQIHFIQEPEADSATIVTDPVKGKILVRWKIKDDKGMQWQWADGTSGLDVPVKAIIGY